MRNSRRPKTIYWYGMYLYNNFSDGNHKPRVAPNNGRARGRGRGYAGGRGRGRGYKPH